MVLYGQGVLEGTKQQRAATRGLGRWLGLGWGEAEGQGLRNWLLQGLRNSEGAELRLLKRAEGSFCRLHSAGRSDKPWVSCFV